MADVMLSYAREDRSTAQLLARRLEQEGLEVWWDPEIPPGTSFDEVIDAALRSARWVVVLWSASSVGSRWVVAEAEEATIHAKLVPALIDDVLIPLAFRRIQAADLIGWHGEIDHPGYRALVATLHSRPATLAPLTPAARAGAPAPQPAPVAHAPAVQAVQAVPPVPSGRSVPSAPSFPSPSGSPRRRSHVLLPAVLVLLIGAAVLAAWWIASDDGGTSPSPEAPSAAETEDDTAIDEDSVDDDPADVAAGDAAADTGSAGGETPPPPPTNEPPPPVTRIPPFPADLLSEPLTISMPLADPRPAASPHDVAAAYLDDSLANLDGCPEAHGEVLRVDVDGDATAVVDIVAPCMDHADSLIPHAGGLRYTLRMEPNDTGSWEVIDMVPQVYCPDGVVRGALCNE